MTHASFHLYALLSTPQTTMYAQNTLETLYSGTISPNTLALFVKRVQRWTNRFAAL